MAAQRMSRISMSGHMGVPNYPARILSPLKPVSPTLPLDGHMAPKETR